MSRVEKGVALFWIVLIALGVLMQWAGSEDSALREPESARVGGWNSSQGVASRGDDPHQWRQKKEDSIVRGGIASAGADGHVEESRPSGRYPRERIENRGTWAGEERQGAAPRYRSEERERRSTQARSGSKLSERQRRDRIARADTQAISLQMGEGESFPVVLAGQARAFESDPSGKESDEKRGDAGSMTGSSSSPSPESRGEDEIKSYKPERRQSYGRDEDNYYCQLAAEIKENCALGGDDPDRYEFCLAFVGYYTNSRHCGYRP